MPNALIHTIEPEGSLHAEHDTVLSERNVCIAYHKEGRAALHKTLAGPSFKRWVQPQQLIARDELMDPNGTTTWQGAAARSVLYGFSESVPHRSRPPISVGRSGGCRPTDRASDRANGGYDGRRICNDCYIRGRSGPGHVSRSPISPAPWPATSMPLMR